MPMSDPCFHPCVTAIKFIEVPASFDITYMHKVKDGICTVCEEVVGMPILVTDPPWADSPEAASESKSNTQI